MDRLLPEIGLPHPPGALSFRLRACLLVRDPQVGEETRFRGVTRLSVKHPLIRTLLAAKKNTGNTGFYTQFK